MPSSLPPSSSVPPPRQPSLVPKESESNQAIGTKSAPTHTEAPPSSTTQGKNSGSKLPNVTTKEPKDKQDNLNNVAVELEGKEVLLKKKAVELEEEEDLLEKKRKKILEDLEMMEDLEKKTKMLEDENKLLQHESALLEEILEKTRRLVQNQTATRPHLFFRLRQEARFTSSTSSRPWISSSPPLIEQPSLMSGQETHYYYATESQMVFIEKLEAMREKLYRDEMQLVQKYDGRWFICAVGGGILGACSISRAFCWNPLSAVFVYVLLATACILFLGAGVYIDWRKSKLLERSRYDIRRRRKELKDRVDMFNNDELTANNAHRLTNRTRVLIELKDAQSRVNLLKESLTGQAFFQIDHVIHMTLRFIGALFYLAAITFMIIFLHSRDPPNYCYFPSNYRYMPPPSQCQFNPPNY